MEPTRKKSSGFSAVMLGVASVMGGLGILLTGIVPAYGQGQPQPAGAVPVQNTAANGSNFSKCDELLKNARLSLASGDHVNAETLLHQAKALNVPYPENSNCDRPAYVEPLIAAHRQWLKTQATEGNLESVRRLRAENLSAQAYGFLCRNDFETAAKLANEALVQNVTFNSTTIQSGMDPESILKKISYARIASGAPVNPSVQGSAAPPSETVLRQAQQFVPHLQEARNSLKAGNLNKAEQICVYLLSQQIPDAAYTSLGDSPSQIMREISVIRTQQTNITNAAYNTGLNAGHVTQVQNTTSPVAIPPSTGLTNPANPVPPPAVTAAPVLPAANGSNPSELVIHVNQLLVQADQLTEQRQPNEAKELLGKLRGEVEAAQVSQEVKTAQIRKIDSKIQNVQDYIDRNAGILEVEARNKQIMDERKQSVEDLRVREAEIQKLVEEFNTLMNQQRYKEAELIAERVRLIDPKGTIAIQMKNTSMFAGRQNELDAIKEKRERGVYEMMVGELAATIANVGDGKPLDYGDNWSVISQRQGFTELNDTRSEATILIMKKLRGMFNNKIDNLPLGMVLNTIQANQGFNIHIDEQALREANVSTDTPVTLNLVTGIRLENALNLILDPLGLGYMINNEVLVITSKEKSRGVLVPRTYYVGDLAVKPFDTPRRFGTTGSEALNEAFMRTNMRGAGAGFPSAGNSMITPVSFSAAVNTPGKTSASKTRMIDEGLLAQVMGGNGSMNYGTGGGGGAASADYDSLINLIQSTIEPDSWTGEDQIQIYDQSRSLIINQTEEIHAKITELLGQLRKMNDLQVTVEVRFITLADKFFEHMGLDFDVSFRNSQNNKYAFLNSSSSTTDTTNTNNTNNTNNSSSSTGSNSNAFTLGVKNAANTIAGLAISGSAGAPVFTSDLSVMMNQDSYTMSKPTFGGYSPDAGTSFGFAILSDIESYFFMTAAQGDERTNLLQAPKVTMMNGQLASISDTTVNYFVTSVNPVVGDFAVAYQPVIMVINEGQFLNVQATVSSDRRHVRMTMVPFFSQVTDIRTFRFEGETSLTDESNSTSKGSGTLPSVTDENANSQRTEARTTGTTVQQPVISEFQISTTVSVPDGGTILLGGIKRLSEGRKEYGVPMVNKIPYLNRLFMNTAIGRETQSMMMMVTPHIIIQEEHEQSITGQRATSM
ncbi:MAG: hypothetical protein LBQ54_11140 [Planctomycetaceae bacterium]|nr:hypothetical protein [Planctomycetaceae bacterium]